MTETKMATSECLSLLSIRQIVPNALSPTHPTSDKRRDKNAKASFGELPSIPHHNVLDDPGGNTAPSS
jgi:hypothetical protein